MLAESLPPGMTAFGWLARDTEIALPERHLGLVQATEVDDIDTHIAQAAEALHDMNPALPPTITFTAPVTTNMMSRGHDLLLHGVRIAIAQDAAFVFLYRANIELLQALGANLTFFSPLEDDMVPSADTLYLPGGYPELHLERLASNEAMKTAIRTFHSEDRPIVAECGGMLYLLESFADVQGHHAEMIGLLPGKAFMQQRLANLGLHRAPLPGARSEGILSIIPVLRKALCRSRIPSPPETMARRRRSIGRGD